MKELENPKRPEGARKDDNFPESEAEKKIHALATGRARQRSDRSNIIINPSNNVSSEATPQYTKQQEMKNPVTQQTQNIGNTDTSPPLPPTTPNETLMLDSKNLQNYDSVEADFQKV